MPLSKVDVLDPPAARDLLLRRSGSQDAEAADRLAKKLEYLPLALEIAGSYIHQQGGGFGIADYLRLYEKSERKMLNEPPVESYPRSVYLTWQASVARLTPVARRMLELHSFLAPAPCPLALYVQEPEADELEVRAWAKDLYRYSLAEPAANATFIVHSLLQAVERHELSERGEDVPTLEAVQTLLVSYGGKPPGNLRAARGGICCCLMPKRCSVMRKSAGWTRAVACFGGLATPTGCVGTTALPFPLIGSAW